MILRMVILRGIPLSVLGMAGMAWIWMLLDLPPIFLPILGVLPLTAGSFVAAHGAANRMRRHGLQTGLRCAAWLSGFWYAAVCLLTHCMGWMPAVLVTLPAGILGGICGVNRPSRALHPTSHLQTGMRQKWALRVQLFHKPKKVTAFRDDIKL